MSDNKSSRSKIRDEKRYHVPATDAKGHSHRAQFYMPPVMMAQVQKIISSGRTPLRRNGDLYRVAVYHMVKEIEMLDKEIPSVMRQVDAMLEITRDAEMAADFEEVFVRLSKQVSDHIGRNGENEARRLCLVIKKQIEKMPDGYWKRRYSEEFEQKFQHILSPNKRASFKKTEEEE